MPAGIILSRTGRRLTFEYSLVGGVNDTSEDARELAELVKGLNCHINLIPVNPIKETGLCAVGPAVPSCNFKNKLEKYRDKCYYKKRNGPGYRWSLRSAAAQLHGAGSRSTEDTPESGGEGERR